MSEPSPDPSDTAAAVLFDRGVQVYFAADYDSARALLEQALAAAGTSGDSVVVADALTWLGLTAWRQSRYADARSLGESALALKQRRAMREELSRSYNALGLLARDEARLSDALSLFTQSLAAAQAVNDSAGIGRALGNRGLVYFDMGDFAGARDGYLAQREMAAAAAERRAEANALVNLAKHDIRLGDPYGALPYLERARALYRDVGHPVGEENVLGQIGTAYDRMGDLHRAIAYLDSALVLARRHGLGQQESEDLQLLADLFGQLGDHVRALELLSQARHLTVALGQTGDLGGIARSESRAYAALGRNDLALERAAEALRLHRAAGAPMEELLDQVAIAELAERSGDSRNADRAIAAARLLARRLDVPVARARVAVGMARVADVRGDPAAVLDALGNGRPDLSRLRAGLAWEAFALEARAYARRGQLEQAVEAGRAAIELIEQVRGRIASGPLRVSFTAHRAAVYGDLVVNLLRLGRTDEAFQVADAARGRALLEHIAAARDGGRAGTARLAEAERLLRRIDWLVERLQQVDTMPELERGSREYAHTSALMRSLVTARREYEAVLHYATSSDPGGAALLGSLSFDAGMVRRALEPGEALIQFFVGPERLVTFVATRDTIHPIEVQLSDADLATRTRLAHDVASSRGSSGPETQPALRALYELLIAPAEASGLLHGIRTLILVPHGSLVHVPFAALVGAGGRYLVEDFALIMLPSASSLPGTRQRQARGNGRHSVLAPFPDRLPASRAEAVAVSRILRGATRSLGSSADETALRRALARPGIVHVASHGVLNETSPMFSRVELAMPRRRQLANDGRLEVHELLGMTVRSRLVFLSGCETAAGVAWSNPFRLGQDYATLAQAFLYAGAAEVIATLWRIDDRGAAVFAERFYTELGSRATAEALAEAQRSMIRHPVYSAPRYWAAYTLSGAGSSEERSIPAAKSVHLPYAPRSFPSPG